MESPPAPAIHVLLVSFPGQGHLNPLLRFAKRIAAKGLLVTLTSTGDTGRTIAASSAGNADLGGEGVTVGLGRLRVEFLDDAFSGKGLNELIQHLDDVGPKALTGLIARQADAGRPVSCVINNCYVPWAVDVAAALGIPSGVLWMQSCATYSLCLHYHRSLLVDFTADAPISMPGIPTMSAGDVPTYLLPSTPYKSLTNLLLAQFRCLHKATWVFVNSFQDLEHDAVTALDDLGSRLIPVGPLIDGENGGSDGDLRLDIFLPANECISWLDAQAPNSVVYVSLGSIATLSVEELSEMAAGLRSSNRPFLWVLRSDGRQLRPEGFEDEVTADGKGMIIDWSPQERVLAHPATGCFLTHCGWSSTLEALHAGVPVIAFPQWADQPTNAKLIVDVWRVGVRLRPPLKSSNLREAVEAVLGGPDASGIRQKAAEWRGASAAAVKEGGSSDRNIQAFVDELRRGASIQ